MFLVGVGTHLLCEPKEGGLERGNGNWSAVLALRGQSMQRASSGEYNLIRFSDGKWGGTVRDAGVQTGRLGYGWRPLCLADNV